MVPVHYGCHWAGVCIYLEVFRKLIINQSVDSLSAYRIWDSLYSPVVPKQVVEEHFMPLLSKMTILILHMLHKPNTSRSKESAYANTIDSLKVNTTAIHPSQPHGYGRGSFTIILSNCVFKPCGNF